MHQPTLAKWADLLGPLFPKDAEFILNPQFNEIAICWMPPAVPSAKTRTVAISIEPNALKGYRNAQDGQRARADRRLFAHVNSSLKQLPSGNTMTDGHELKIVVAPEDILSR